MAMIDTAQSRSKYFIAKHAEFESLTNGLAHKVEDNALGQPQHVAQGVETLVRWPVAYKFGKASFKELTKEERDAESMGDKKDAVVVWANMPDDCIKHVMDHYKGGLRKRMGLPKLPDRAWKRILQIRMRLTLQQAMAMKLRKLRRRHGAWLWP